MLDRALYRKIVVVSPHLDDGVFSCGDLLVAHPGSMVVTVMAGKPPTPSPAACQGSIDSSCHGKWSNEQTGFAEWDTASGFPSGDDVVGRRREEDRSALQILGATPIWLDLCDSQYQHSPTIEEIAAILEETFERLQPSAVFFPFGLFHSDHVLTHKACLELVWRHRAWDWFAYEDAIYRAFSDDLVNQRRAWLETLGITAAPAGDSGYPASDAKRRAVNCYQSQLRALAVHYRSGHDDVFNPERYWRIVR